MLKIALTGGIGTGKTYLSGFFKSMQFPFYEADQATKELYKKPEIISEVVRILGNEVLEGEVLDFKKMASVVFSDKEKRSVLEQYIHPLVMADFEQWASKQKSEVVFMESAIVFEANLSKYFDLVIAVDASLETRMKRIKKRNPSFTDEMIKQRILSQSDSSDLKKKADLLLLNENENTKDLVYRISKM